MPGIWIGLEDPTQNVSDMLGMWPPLFEKGVNPPHVQPVNRQKHGYRFMVRSQKQNPDDPCSRLSAPSKSLTGSVYVQNSKFSIALMHDWRESTSQLSINTAAVLTQRNSSGNSSSNSSSNSGQ
jgi:hypothetical protein